MGIYAVDQPRYFSGAARQVLATFASGCLPSGLSLVADSTAPSAASPHPSANPDSRTGRRRRPSGRRVAGCRYWPVTGFLSASSTPSTKMLSTSPNVLTSPTRLGRNGGENTSTRLTPPPLSPRQSQPSASRCATRCRCGSCAAKRPVLGQGRRHSRHQWNRLPMRDGPGAEPAGHSRPTLTCLRSSSSTPFRPHKPRVQRCAWGRFAGTTSFVARVQ